MRWMMVSLLGLLHGVIFPSGVTAVNSFALKKEQKIQNWEYILIPSPITIKLFVIKFLMGKHKCIRGKFINEIFRQIITFVTIKI